MADISRSILYHPPCRICGKDFVNMNARDLTVTESDICQSCSFWKRLHENRSNETLYSIDGTLYKVPEKDFLSSERHPRYIYLTKEHKAERVFSLTRVGTIPEAWKDLFPCNATFINGHQYRGIKARQLRGECDRIGCYDRYHCLFYTPELHEANGPWNTVPSKYRIGDEKCPSFFDKDKLKR